MRNDRDIWFVEIITTRWACEYRNRMFCKHDGGNGDCERESCPLIVKFDEIEIKEEDSDEETNEEVN